jgi:hypothetical protein
MANPEKAQRTQASLGNFSAAAGHDEATYPGADDTHSSHLRRGIPYSRIESLWVNSPRLRMLEFRFMPAWAREAN